MKLDLDHYKDTFDQFLKKWNEQVQIIQSMDSSGLHDHEESELCNTCMYLSTVTEYPGQNQIRIEFTKNEEHFYSSEVLK